jgi:hypothetical protein
MPYDALNNDQLIAMLVEVTLKLDALNAVRLAGRAPVARSIDRTPAVDRAATEEYLRAIRRGPELDNLHVELSAEAVARGLQDKLVKALQEARKTAVPDPPDQP